MQKKAEKLADRLSELGFINRMVFSGRIGQPAHVAVARATRRPLRELLISNETPVLSITEKKTGDVEGEKKEGSEEPEKQVVQLA